MKHRVIAIAVIVAAVGIVVTCWEPLWVWFAYESEAIVLVEIPMKMTGPDHGNFDRSKPTHERNAREKRFRSGPGLKFLVEEELCYGCLHKDHDSHNATVALQDPKTHAMIGFHCICQECQE